MAAAVVLTAGIFVALSGAGAAAPAPPPAVAGPATARPAAASAPPAASAAPSTRSPRPTPPAVRVPGLIGAIGDSLTVAVNADGAFGDQPEHSWIVGDAPDDGVASHLERLRAFGADPDVTTAAMPGAAVATAPGQAATVVEAAARLPPGATAYVTFELGANDICAASLADATDVDAFAAAVGSAFGALSDGLPSGSVLVVLSVPDVTRLRTLLEDVPRAQELHRRYGVCRAVLGEAVAPAAVHDRIRAYNGILAAACKGLDESSLDCRFDLAGEPSGSLFGAVFGLDELSSLDFFHPSLAGQARIADEVWPLTPWAGAAAP